VAKSGAVTQLRATGIGAGSELAAGVARSQALIIRGRSTMSRFMRLPARQWLYATSLSIACQQTRAPVVVQDSPAVPAQAASAPVQTELVEPYPPGRWRLADPAQQEHVMLWFRQILIRHRDTPSGLVSNNLPHWRGAPAPPARTRAEAFALAQSIADEARLHPAQFARLAEARSEDIATRQLGGAVGGLQASAIRVRGVLDVMQALRPDEVSRVVETGYGFHVFQRLAPPIERRVSGSRIVIAHDDAPWLEHFLARWPIARRSKALALALADDIYRQLRTDPARFDELLQEYSDHQDAVRGGDFGEWSTREITAFPREIEVLERLQPGEVAAPMDSLFGVQIIKRMPEHERTHFAYTAVRLRFDSAAPPGSEQSEASVAERARAIADDVFAFPSAFEDYQRQLGGSSRSDQIQGRGDGSVERVLEQLAPGQVARSAIRLRNEYLLLQRLTPQLTSHAAAVELELPAPDHADLRMAVAQYGLRLLATGGSTLAQSAIDPARRERARALLDALPTTSGVTAGPQLAELERQLQELLGADTADYMNRLRAGVEASLLESRPSWRLVVPSAPAEFFASTARAL
jgi:PPIC-type PPIASE domain